MCSYMRFLSANHLHNLLFLSEVCRFLRYIVSFSISVWNLQVRCSLQQSVRHSIITPAHVVYVLSRQAAITGEVVSFLRITLFVVHLHGMLWHTTHRCLHGAESKAAVLLPVEWVLDSCLSTGLCEHTSKPPVKNFWWSWNSDIFQSYNQSQYDREITTFPQEQSVSSSANQLIWCSHK